MNKEAEILANTLRYVNQHNPDLMRQLKAQVPQLEQFWCQQRESEAQRLMEAVKIGLSNLTSEQLATLHERLESKHHV